METIVSRIYMFPDGTEIDLKRIIMIGSLDKEINTGFFIVQVHTEKREKPIVIRLGFSLGKVEPELKEKILTTLTDFKEEWRSYTMQNDKPD